MIKTVTALSLLLFCSKVLACGYIIPNLEVSSLAEHLQYRDFPTEADILAIISVESSFNPLAINKFSNGIMQVNHASFEIKENMGLGVQLLREYYLKTKSIQSAVISYNIGIGNFHKHRLLKKGGEYYHKYLIQRLVYSRYLEEVKFFGHSISRRLSCSS